jgi:IS5 family transposase
MPDSSSVWLFRDTLAKSRFTPPADDQGNPGKEIDSVRALFDLFHCELAAKGLLCREGKTVDAMIMEFPRQRTPREENKSIKRGETPEVWKKQSRRLAQKDTDASWTPKRGQNYFGYKNSIVGGNTDCFVHDYVVSVAHPHDSKIVLESYYETAGAEEPVAFGDSAYGSPDIVERLRRNGITPLIHEKGTRGHPLNELKIEMNHLKSKIRAGISRWIHAAFTLRIQRPKHDVRQVQARLLSFPFEFRN